MRIGDGELGKEFAEPEAGELEGEFLDFVGLIVFGKLTGEIESGGEDFETILMPEPILVTTVVPSGDVLLKDFVRERRVGGLFESLDDLGVGKAVREELVDEVAEFFGETGDFAVAPAAGRPAGWIGGLVD